MVLARLVKPNEGGGLERCQEVYGSISGFRQFPPTGHARDEEYPGDIAGGGTHRTLPALYVGADEVCADGKGAITPGSGVGSGTVGYMAEGSSEQDNPAAESGSRLTCEKGQGGHRPAGIPKF